LDSYYETMNIVHLWGSNNMRLLSKTMVALPLIAQLLSSCGSHQKLSGQVPITHEFLSTLESGKDYRFELKSGFNMEVYIKQVNHESITGYSYHYDSNSRLTKLEYAEAFQRIENNVVSISELRRKPYLFTQALDKPMVPITVPDGPNYTREELERKIKKSQKMKEAGTTLTVLGGLAVAGGVIAYIAKDVDNLSGDQKDANTEGAVIGIGMAIAAPGALLWILGSKKERKYKKELDSR